MPICENCNNKWSWQQTVKKTSTLDPAMICPYCEKKQYQTQKSRIISSLLTSVVVFLMIFIPNSFDISLVGTIGFLPILIALIVLLFPYSVKLSSTEESINFFKSKS